MAELAVVPQWEGPFQDYARGFVSRNAWRVSWRYDRDECMGIAGEVFARIIARYSGKVHPKYGTVTDPKHWMGIFKQALSNEFHTYAYEARAYVEAQQRWGEEELARRGDIEYNEGTLSVLLSGASQELRDVMEIVGRAPAELLELLLAESDDAAWSRRLCRLCRIPRVSETIVSELRDLLSGVPAT